MRYHKNFFLRLQAAIFILQDARNSLHNILAGEDPYQEKMDKMEQSLYLLLVVKLLLVIVLLGLLLQFLLFRCWISHRHNLHTSILFLF